MHDEIDALRSQLEELRVKSTPTPPALALDLTVSGSSPSIGSLVPDLNLLANGSRKEFSNPKDIHKTSI